MKGFFQENYNNFCSYNISMVMSSYFGMKETDYMKSKLLEEIENGKDFTKHDTDPTQLYNCFEYLDDEVHKGYHQLTQMLEEYAEYICDTTEESKLSVNYVYEKWAELLTFLGHKVFYPTKRDYYELEKFVWTIVDDEKTAEKIMKQEWKNFDVNLSGHELGTSPN